MLFSRVYNTLIAFTGGVPVKALAYAASFPSKIL